MPSIVLTEGEMETLYGLPFPCTVLYLCLRRRMDFATGRVGAVHSISWQGVTEYLYVEGRPGIKAQHTSRWAAMRLCGHLQRAGLVRLESNPASGRLIFNLLRAHRSNSAPQKAAPKPQGFPQGGRAGHDIGETGKPSTRSRKGVLPKAAQHQVSDVYHNAAAASPATRAAGLVFGESLNGLSAMEQGAMRRTLKNNPACQGVLDELDGMMQKGNVKNPVALFRKLFTDHQNGTLIFSHANRIAAERELQQVNEEMHQ